MSIAQDVRFPDLKSAKRSGGKFRFFLAPDTDSVKVLNSEPVQAPFFDEKDRKVFSFHSIVSRRELCDGSVYANDFDE